MKAMLMLLILAASHAYMVPTDLKGEQDTGAASLPPMRATLITDCGNGSITAFVSDNQTGNAVPGATMFIFRTDSGYRVLNRTQTDSEGRGSLGVPGKIAYLNDLYVLRIEKSGYRSKEVQLTFWNCDEVNREYSEFSKPDDNGARANLSVQVSSAPERNGSETATAQDSNFERQPEPAGTAVAIAVPDGQKEAPGPCAGLMVPISAALLIIRMLNG